MFDSTPPPNRDTMKTIQTVQGLCLLAILTGPLKVLCHQKIPLDMANNSVDDQYIGCNPMRELKLQEPGYLPLPPKYKTTWKRATEHWDKLGQSVGNFSKIYGTAIAAYTYNSDFCEDFNKATRTARKSQSSYNRYAFKDYHFLLTKALQAKDNKGKCYEVFRGIENIQFTVHIKQHVRFGHFASSSLVKKEAERFGTDTFFSIGTCYGVPIYDFSYFPEEMEILIPPYEKFIVKSQKGRTIRLESQGVSSCFNCEVLKGAGC